jgi:hypothetical protein
MESRGEREAGMEEAFLALAGIDINWKNKYIGSETIRRQFPIAGRAVGNF